MNKLLYIIIIAVVFNSCSQENAKKILPGSTGKSGELVIVIKKDLWESNVGDTLRHTLAQAQTALPQPEPILTLINIPPEGFSNIFQLHRNILIIDISKKYTEPEIYVEQEKWANYQLVLNFHAPDKNSFLSYFNENKEKIISKILIEERNRISNAQKKNQEQGIVKKLEKEHKISIVVPEGYTLDVDSASFVWISFTNAEIDQGVFVYYYPYIDKSQFLKESLLYRRNTTLKRYVHGSAPGSFMTTEDLFPVIYNTYYKSDGSYIAELRGLWKLEKGYMGGPFVSISTIDSVYNRIVTVEGYVFAPNKEKRNLLRQVEAIVHSLVITK